MKRVLKVSVLLLCIICLCACGNKYEGYWCKYNESNTIVVLLKDDISEGDISALENTIKGYDNLISYYYFDKSSYGDIDPDSEIYNSYVISFSNAEYLDTYLNQLKDMSGIYEVSSNSVKNDFMLYHIDKNNKYTLKNSDEALDEDIINGKYKIKNGVITFTPNDGDSSMLYIKDDHLCGDVECNIIFAKSNSNCSGSHE